MMQISRYGFRSCCTERIINREAAFLRIKNQRKRLIAAENQLQIPDSSNPEKEGEIQRCS
jgi:hypothetical protein